jgi:hypothetical protein
MPFSARNCFPAARMIAYIDGLVQKIGYKSPEV